MAMEFAPSKKKRKRMPGYAIFIIIFGALSVIVGIARGIVKAQTEKSIAQVNDLLGADTSTSDAPSETYVGIIPVRYKGFSVKIPEGWTYRTSDSEGALIHRIYIESPDVDYSNICWGLSEHMLSPREWVQKIHDTGGEDFPNFSPGEILCVKYCGQDAYTFDFSMKKLGFTYYARIITFEKSGKCIMVINMSDFKSSLSKKFGFIEETLSFD